MDSSPASSRSSSGWFAVLQDDLMNGPTKRGLPGLPDILPNFLTADSEGTTDTERAESLPQPEHPVVEIVTKYTSDRHEKGRCDPCVFFTSVGCSKGVGCPYCHLPHGEVKSTHRPRKQTRDKYKADLQDLLLQHDGRLEEIHAELQAEARKNPYVRKLLQGYLDGREEEGMALQLRPVPQALPGPVGPVGPVGPGGPVRPARPIGPIGPISGLGTGPIGPLSTGPEIDPIFRWIPPPPTTAPRLPSGFVNHGSVVPPLPSSSSALGLLVNIGL
eukprot:s141_g3.t1